jgi:ornithine carbamoyltransferase
VQRIAAERAEATGARITPTGDPDEALGAADLVYTDGEIMAGTGMQDRLHTIKAVLVATLGSG